MEVLVLWKVELGSYVVFYSVSGIVNFSSPWTILDYYLLFKGSSILEFFFSLRFASLDPEENVVVINGKYYITSVITFCFGILTYNRFNTLITK